ncbi:DUF262 domain-containing protein [Candidatus Thiosymbion oneisti]|uniref:DUF262 domain-containing protein n=1 Tax=Candidatus Thiosymbion oneisti TaxID=589554 RepID=UPI000A88A3C7|nr:DUF262 domain-containing protein [Candidatus Thiosymbion oneisti]
MANHPISQPTAKTFSVVDLVAAALAGRLRIPEFQRPLRWQWKDVSRLFDSIVKGYPIGNLLLWTRPAPEAEVRLGALRIQAQGYQDGLWVVDGQQRLTSLANALSDAGAQDERFGLAYDLNQQQFVRLRQQEGDGYTVPLPVLFDLQRLIRWFTKDYPEAGERLDAAARVTRAIREYQVPAYLVEQQDEAVLRDIFDRMNNYGKRLSRAEVFSALHPGYGKDREPSLPFQRIADTIQDGLGFGLLDDDTVLRAVLARRGGNVTRDIRTEFSAETRKPRDFQGETPEQAYREGEEALYRAVRFLQEDAGVPHFAFLPYRYLLVVLTRFFAHFPEPHPRNRILLVRWFWRAAMIGPGPFGSSWTNAMEALANRIAADEESESIQRLLSTPIDAKLHRPKLTGFRTNAAGSRIILAALWDLHPRSLLTGDPYDREALAEAVLPDGTLKGVARTILKREPPDHMAMAANRIFVIDEELPEPVDKLLIAPPLHRRGDEQAFLNSHALDPESVAALARGDKIGFLTQRQAKIRRIVDDFLSRMAGKGHEDTPPLDSLDLDDPDDAAEGRDDRLA